MYSSDNERKTSYQRQSLFKAHHVTQIINLDLTSVKQVPVEHQLTNRHLTKFSNYPTTYRPYAPPLTPQLVIKLFYYFHNRMSSHLPSKSRSTFTEYFTLFTPKDCEFDFKVAVQHSLLS